MSFITVTLYFTNNLILIPSHFHVVPKLRLVITPDARDSFRFHIPLVFNQDGHHAFESSSHFIFVLFVLFVVGLTEFSGPCFEWRMTKCTPRAGSAFARHGERRRPASRSRFFFSVTLCLRVIISLRAN